MATRSSEPSVPSVGVVRACVGLVRRVFGFAAVGGGEWCACVMPWCGMWMTAVRVYGVVLPGLEPGRGVLSLSGD